jgi:rhodanese-related sulfurtransferase
MRRLEPPEVNELLDSDRVIHVIDLRHDYDYQLQPFMVPTAIRVPMESIDLHHHRIPKDSDIILYCS